jgi:hypothetical protein
MAMENGGLSPSDVALLNNNGFGDGGAFMWIFALLILANGGFGNWGGNGNGNANAIQADVNRGFDNQNLQAQTRDILSAVNAGTAQAVAATNQTFHDNLSAMQSLYNETARDIAGLAVGQANALANQNECCCATKMLIQENASNTNAQIAQSKYDTSMQMAQLEQKIMSKLDANKIEELQNQVNQLQLAQATAGMLRFPNSWSYGAGPFPPIFGGCSANI